MGDSLPAGGGVLRRQRQGHRQPAGRGARHRVLHLHVHLGGVRLPEVRRSSVGNHEPRADRPTPSPSTRRAVLPDEAADEGQRAHRRAAALQRLRPRPEQQGHHPRAHHQLPQGQARPHHHGEQTREFNYVGNLVDGLLAAAEDKSTIEGPVNLASGEEVAIRDLVRKNRRAHREVSPPSRLARWSNRPTEIWLFAGQHAGALAVRLDAPGEPGRGPRNARRWKWYSHYLANGGSHRSEPIMESILNPLRPLARLMPGRASRARFATWSATGSSARPWSRFRCLPVACPLPAWWRSCGWVGATWATPRAPTTPRSPASEPRRRPAPSSSAARCLHPAAGVAGRQVGRGDVDAGAPAQRHARVSGTLERQGLRHVHNCLAPLRDHGGYSWYSPTLRRSEHAGLLPARHL